VVGIVEKYNRNGGNLKT